MSLVVIKQSYDVTHLGQKNFIAIRNTYDWKEYSIAYKDVPMLWSPSGYVIGFRNHLEAALKRRRINEHPKTVNLDPGEIVEKMINLDVNGNAPKYPRGSVESLLMSDFDYGAKKSNVTKCYRRMLKKYPKKIDKIFKYKKKIIGFQVGDSVFVQFPSILKTLTSDDYFNTKEAFHLYSAITASNQKALLDEFFKEAKKEYKIGADPELNILFKNLENKEEVTPDYSLFPYPANRLFDGNATESKLGTDGRNALLELRPSPAKYPKALSKEIKVLLEQLAEKLDDHNEVSKERVFLESGGGFLHSIGGHIHFGGKVFKQLASNGKIGKLGQMLDDFLYYPIKLNMPGAIREWSEADEIQKEKLYTASNTTQFKIHQRDVKGAISAGKMDKDVRFVSFEEAGSFREQPWGAEYRSLPSFICDFNFTSLVFKLAFKLGKRYLDVLSGKPFEYNAPPMEKEYRQFLTPTEWTQWKQYIGGKKKSVFLEDVFTGWKISKPSGEKLPIFFLDTMGWKFAPTPTITTLIKSMPQYTKDLLTVHRKTFKKKFPRIGLLISVKLMDRDFPNSTAFIVTTTPERQYVYYTDDKGFTFDEAEAPNADPQTAREFSPKERLNRKIWAIMARANLDVLIFYRALPGATSKEHAVLTNLVKVGLKCISYPFSTREDRHRIDGLYCGDIDFSFARLLNIHQGGKILPTLPIEDAPEVSGETVRQSFEVDTPEQPRRPNHAIPETDFEWEAARNSRQQQAARPLDADGLAEAVRALDDIVVTTRTADHNEGNADDPEEDN